MTEHTRFGPAGVPPMFRLMGATMPDVPKLLHEEGLTLSSTKHPGGDLNRR